MSTAGPTIVMGGGPVPSSGGSSIAIFIVFLMLCAIGYAIYHVYTTGSSAGADTSASDSSAPPPPPPPDMTTYGPSAAPSTVAAASAPPADPKATLIATGKALQVAEMDVSVSPPVALGTSGVDTTQPVAYTISMFINIEKTSGSWRNLFLRGANDSDRKPGIFITPNALTFHFRHGTDNNGNFGLDATAAGATAGQYTHVAFVNDGTTMSVYINGTKDTNTATIDPAHKCVWGTNDTIQASAGPNNAPAGYIKIKEMYIFPKALADADIKTLSTPAATTTSTYTEEPVTSTGTDFVGMISSYEVEPITSTEGDYLGMVE